MTQPAVDDRRPRRRPPGARTRYVIDLQRLRRDRRDVGRSRQPDHRHAPRGDDRARVAGRPGPRSSTATPRRRHLPNPGSTRVVRPAASSAARSSTPATRCGSRCAASPTRSAGAKTARRHHHQRPPDRDVSGNFTVVPGNSLPFVAVKVGSTAPLARRPTSSTSRPQPPAAFRPRPAARSRSRSRPAPASRASRAARSTTSSAGSTSAPAAAAPGSCIIVRVLQRRVRQRRRRAADHLPARSPTRRSAGPYSLTASDDVGHRRVDSSDYTPGCAGDDDRLRPAGPTSDATPTFTFSSTVTGFVRVPARPAAFGACTSPYTAPTLADGSHTFEVRALDTAGAPDTTPASRTFIVDTLAPATPITAGPTGDRRQHAARPSRSPPRGAERPSQCSFDERGVRHVPGDTLHGALRGARQRARPAPHDARPATSRRLPGVAPVHRCHGRP